MKNSFTTLILMSALSFSCAEKGVKEQMPPLKLAVIEAKSELIPNRMTFVGQTSALNSYTIEPRVSGYLTKINFTGGQLVKKGQLLFKIDPITFETQVAQAKANLASAQAELTQAENNYNRSVPLAKINAISKSQLDAATATMQSAKESVIAARANLRNANLNLSYTTITSPDNGIVEQPKASIGDFVGVGTQYQVLTTVSDNRDVTVNLAIPTAKYYNIVSSEQQSNKNDSLLSDIALKISDSVTYPYKGKYRYTAQNIDNQSGAIILQVEFPNPDGLLKAGQFARVGANVGKSKYKIVVPQVCVNEIQGNYSVWVLGKDNKAEFRKVDVGQTFGQMWIIENGLQAGEKVITEGFSKLHDGMTVEPLEKR